MTLVLIRSNFSLRMQHEILVKSFGATPAILVQGRQFWCNAGNFGAMLDILVQRWTFWCKTRNFGARNQFWCKTSNFGVRPAILAAAEGMSGTSITLIPPTHPAPTHLLCSIDAYFIEPPPPQKGDERQC